MPASAAEAPGGFGGFGGFGTRRPPPPPQKGADIAYRLPISFEDAAALKEQRVTLAGGKTVSIKLPAGVEEGTKIRLAGQGQAGPGGNGDAIVTISIKPHRFFTRDGDNIRLDLPISLDEAVLGAKVKVPTVDGPVMLSVPAGTSSGKVLRLKGKGFTAKGGQRGDQLVTLMIDVPADGRGARPLRRGLEPQGQGKPEGAGWASSRFMDRHCDYGKSRSICRGGLRSMVEGLPNPPRVGSAAPAIAGRIKARAA